MAGLPQSCAVCTMHLVDRCVRHAPGPSMIKPRELTRWPIVRPDQRCGEGSTESQPVHCGACLHWHQPGASGGAPAPVQRRESYWGAGPTDLEATPPEDLGFCTRFAPAPGPDARATEWRLTRVTDKCGDGEAVPQPDPTLTTSM